MKQLLQPYKGTRDFYPEDKRLQNYIFTAWHKACQKYGYEEVDGPMLEPLDLYRMKNQTNDEIVNEQVYSFTDRGEREVALRPEMTPTVSRMVAAKRQELAYPARWYCIPNLYRYERPQKGRLREHWQLNVDVFGLGGVEAEFELIQVAAEILKQLGAKESMFEIRINHRDLTEVMLKNYLGLNDTQFKAMVGLIDRKAKMDPGAFVSVCEQILSPSQRDEGLADKLDQLLLARSPSELPTELVQSEGYTQLKELFELLDKAGISNAIYDSSIMRGFDYYTGIVFEVFDTSTENNRSMLGGGRYDGLVGAFGVDPVSTVGFGMGDVTALDFVATHKLASDITPTTHVSVVLIGDVYKKVQGLLSTLRDEGLNVAVDSSGRKLAKQIDAASKNGIRYVLFAGQDEIDNGQFKLKDITTGEEESLSAERIVSKLLAN